MYVKLQMYIKLYDPQPVADFFAEKLQSNRKGPSSGRRLHAVAHLEPAGYPALIQPDLESHYHGHYPHRTLNLPALVK